jgi:hypothetical protein
MNIFDARDALIFRVLGVPHKKAKGSGYGSTET